MITRDRMITRDPSQRDGFIVNRRAVLLGGAALFATSRAAAQSRGTPLRLAIVHPSHPTAGMNATGIAQYRAFFAELGRLGFIEGHSIVIDRWSAEGRGGYEELARAVASRKPDVILVGGNELARVLKDNAPATPIVGVIADPVRVGLSASMARPDGNVTSVAIDAGSAFHGKRLDLLLEAVPTAKRVAHLLSSDFEVAMFGLSEVAAHRRVSLVGVRLEGLVPLPAYPQAFAAMAQDRIDAVFVGTNPLHLTHRATIVALAASARLPASYQWRDFVDIGGLMSYAPSLPDLYRRCADYVVRILKGAKPGDLPIQQPEKFELAINLKTAKALGLMIPPSLLARADEVIE